MPEPIVITDIIIDNQIHTFLDPDKANGNGELTWILADKVGKVYKWKFILRERLQWTVESLIKYILKKEEKGHKINSLYMHRTVFLEITEGDMNAALTCLLNNKKIKSEKMVIKIISGAGIEEILSKINKKFCRIEKADRDAVMRSLGKEREKGGQLIQDNNKNGYPREGIDLPPEDRTALEDQELKKFYEELVFICIMGLPIYFKEGGVERYTDKIEKIGDRMEDFLIPYEGEKYLEYENINHLPIKGNKKAILDELKLLLETQPNQFNNVYKKFCKAVAEIECK